MLHIALEWWSSTLKEKQVEKLLPTTKQFLFVFQRHWKEYTLLLNLYTLKG